MTEVENPSWPALPLSAWEDTRDTVLLWTQVIGKVRLAHAPFQNHWWNVPLYVSARGLTTSLIPYGNRGFEMELDLHRHELVVRTTDGATGSLALEPMSVATFHARCMALLDELEVPTTIWPVPVEIPGAVPFPDDEAHTAYDPEAMHRFWVSLVQADRIFHRFSGRFTGKVSPVHFFWGAFDLAVTRFSGRPAPAYTGAVPNCGPHVMHEAYSHEVSSAGYWPGGSAEGSFYSYAYPEPEGYADTPVPDGAYYDTELREFLLPYELVRQADDPDALVLDFLQATYEAAADRAGWDRQGLERAEDDLPPPGAH